VGDGESIVDSPPSVPFAQRLPTMLPPPTDLSRVGKDAFPPAWGYAAPRNALRWKLISTYLRILFTSLSPYSSATPQYVTDYGADQGYFSVLTARTFPGTIVNAVDKGAVGGSLWKSSKKMKDVLETAAEKARENGIPSTRFTVCRTLIHPSMWRRLREEGLTFTVVFVLSVLHWFDIDGEDGFHGAMRSLFQISRVVIVELPHPDAKGTYGERRYRKWFKRERNGTKLLEISASGVPGCKVVLLGRLPWGEKLFREIHSIECPEKSPPFMLEAKQRSEAFRRIHKCQ